MKKYLVVTFLVLVMALSACGPLSPIDPSMPVDDSPAGQPTPNPDPDVLPTPASGGGYPAAAHQARAGLASQLNLPEEQVEVTGITPKDWPDTCLGLPAPGEACGEMIVSGYEVILTAGALQYTFRTDYEGRNIRQDGAPVPATAGEESRSLFEWQSPACEVFTVSTQGAFFGQCGETLLAVPDFDGGQEPFKNWIKTLAPFEADTPAGKARFNGLGSTLATPAEQRMLAEWARLQYESARSGRSGAAWGLAFSYRREGGIAGFCDEAAVYLDGRVLVSSCKGLNASLYMTATELQQVYAWHDDLKAFDYSHSDPATADQMTITLTTAGQGQNSAGEAAVRAMLEFIAGLAARASFAAQAGPEQSSAEQALVDYFRALNSGDFSAGAKLYGGPSDLLETWNPDIKNDLPAWLERGCTQNGLQCLLPRSIRFRGPDARGGYQFVVEFNLPDGSLFTQGPCCGDPDGAVATSFLFSVLQGASGWQVMDLPPYVP